MLTNASHIGSKGYALDKSQLSSLEQKQIIKNLWISPIVQRGTSPKFPIFRESNRFIYMPRYYGITHFGIPEKNIIQPGDDIHLEFNGSLRPNQENVVKTYLNYISNPHFQGGLLELPCAYGKCLGKNTPLFMHNGTIQLVQDIQPNDLLMGDDSTPRRVLSICSGKEKMYKIINTSVNNDFYICNESHILSLKRYCNNNNNYRIEDIPLIDYLQLPISIQKEYKGYKVSLHFPEKQVMIDPYVYGFYILSPKYYDEKSEIEENYLINNWQNRLQLLTGIIDSIGKINHNTIHLLVDHVSLKLISQIQFLLHSLGYEFIIEYGIISIYGINNSQYLYKTNQEYQLQITDLTHEIQIEELQDDTYYGFEIDGNRRFVLANFTVTHNTVLALNIISELKKKVLVIVQKQFLTNQWINRIQQFLPNARIGRLQGSIIDIEDKDIVIGMLQSISKGKYPPSVFSSFGLTIIDEVHHISSETFSKTLFHVVTKYMLGISATMDRKDGTTDVIKMFLGDLIFKELPTEESLAKNKEKTIRVVRYKSTDPEFLKTIVNERGDMIFSSMLSKISNYIPRTQFIIDLLPSILQEINHQQIIVFSEERNQCHYFHEEITKRNLATVGYYMGGMKEEALDHTVANSQIILATYDMASEGLDIPTLFVIIYATPRCSIRYCGSTSCFSKSISKT